MARTENSAWVDPMLRLPVEINAEIFEQAIWQDLDDFDYFIDDYDYDDGTCLTTPLILGSVCSAWRSLIWSTPALWSVIILKLSSWSQVSDVQIELLDLWLRNSRTCALEIWFSVEQGYEMADFGPAVVALRKLVENSARWKTFFLYVNEDKEFLEVLRQAKGRVPLLQMGHLATEWSFPGATLDMFEDAPLIKRFYITKLNSRYIALPSNLTTFHGRSLTDEGCIKVLSDCPNLVECTFTDAGLAHPDVLTQNEDYLDEPPDVKDITLPHLRSLSVINRSGSYTIQYIFRSIQCPQLRRLYLINDYENVELPFTHIEDFIIRSNCPLEVLQLGDVHKLSLALPLFNRLNSLTCLILQRKKNRKGRDFKDTFQKLLATLEPGKNTSSLLPNLRLLKYDGMKYVRKTA